MYQDENHNDSYGIITIPKIRRESWVLTKIICVKLTE